MHTFFTPANQGLRAIPSPDELAISESGIEAGLRIDREQREWYNAGSMVRTDYHTHTPLCRHAEGSPRDFAAQAKALGLGAYGIADHAPMSPDQEPFDDWRMRCADLPRYQEWIDEVRAEAGDAFSVLCGMECDWLPGIEPWIRRLRRDFPCDYLIGSVHYLGSLGSVDDSLYSNRPLTGCVDDDWRLYWQAVAGMAESGLFDMIGHIDLVKIWGRMPQGDLSRFWLPALEALEGSGTVVELNTAGWHKCCAEQYPSAALLRELLRRHIPIAINSDAHTPGHFSRDWEKAVALLESLADHRLHQYAISARNHPQTRFFVYGSF